jgi:hypothetical protein
LSSSLYLAARSAGAPSPKPCTFASGTPSGSTAAIAPVMHGTDGICSGFGLGFELGHGLGLGLELGCSGVRVFGCSGVRVFGLGY